MWLTSRYCHSICLEGLRKGTKTLPGELGSVTESHSDCPKLESGTHPLHLCNEVSQNWTICKRVRCFRICKPRTYFSTYLTFRRPCIVTYSYDKTNEMHLLTHSMVQSPSWAADWFAARQEISPHFTEPQGSLPHPQASATCLYSGPAQSSPHTHIPPPRDPS